MSSDQQPIEVDPHTDLDTEEEDQLLNSFELGKQSIKNSSDLDSTIKDTYPVSVLVTTLTQR